VLETRGGLLGDGLDLRRGQPQAGDGEVVGRGLDGGACRAEA